MSLFAELKRRNVFKVAASYAIVAWIVLQVADTTFPALNIPAWVLSLLTVLFLLGFPIALFLAWAYEITPDGIKLTAAAPAHNSVSAQASQRMNYLLIAGMVLVVALVVLDSDVMEDAPAVSAAGVATPGAAPAPAAEPTAVAETVPEIPELSIAVLPFTNISSDAEQEYFSDGLTEELLNKLAKIRDLQVAARTSSFYYKGRNENLRDVGVALGVAYILEGSVRKAGDEIRITAQLIRADNGFHVWSLTWDRTLQDIFLVQDEIAEAVAASLSLALGAGEFNRIGMTQNLDAYDAYLQGLAGMDAGIETFADTITAFSRAVELDPGFGLGWLKLQQAYVRGILLLPAEQTREFVPLGQTALSQAAAVAPTMPELLVVTAEANRRSNKWLEAEAQFQQVLAEAANSNADANYLYGHLLASAGRSTDAMDYLLAAKRINPRMPEVSLQLARVLVSLRRFDEADAEADRAIASGLPLNVILGTSIKLMAAYAQDDRNGALEFFGVLSGGNPDDVSFRIATDLAADDVEAARAKLRVLAADQTLSPLLNAAFSLYAGVSGDPELTLEFLRKQANANFGSFFGSNPMWHNYFSAMRKTAGFKELARTAGLENYWRTTGDWGDFCRPLNDDFECF